MQEMAHDDPSSMPQTPSAGAQRVPTVPADIGATDPPLDRSLSLMHALSRAGTLVLSEQERTILGTPFADCDVHQLQLKNRKENYIPHILISRRLNAALGAGQWCLVRLREWYDARAKTVYGSYVLIVRGVWVGDTVAGHEYQPSNPRMDYADALESTRGIALRRIAAKSLGCGDQVWVPSPSPRPAQPGNPPALPATSAAPTQPALTDDQVREILQRGYVAADVGPLALADWWRILTPAERVAVQPYGRDLRDRSDRAQQINEDAAGTFADR